MKKWLSFLPFFVLFLSVNFSPCFAQVKGLIINGNNVSYDKANNLIEATGSVEVLYKDVLIYGENIVYNTLKDTVYARQGFSMLYQGVTVEGDSLDYDIKKFSGNATNVIFTYRKIYLKGEEFQFDREKFALKNSSFSTCDLSDPHYHVTASDINVYPDVGWLVAYWGFFWINRVPVVPVPTYIYDFSDESARNLPPFPEISADNDYGWYITERLAWYMRRELSGTYSLSYYTKKGLGIGGEASYLLTPQSRGNARLYWNMTDGPYGGITHRLFFGDEVRDNDLNDAEKEAPLSFFSLPKYKRYEIDASLSSRERINYQKVSYLPKLEIKVRKSPGLVKGIKHDADIYAGMVGEEGTGYYGEGGAKINFYGDLPESSYGLIVPSIGIDASAYSNGTNWDKFTGRIDLSKKVNDTFSFGLGYIHYFSVAGQSPFLFEMYRFSPLDRLTSQWLFYIGETKTEIATSYFANNWSPEDLDYAFYFRLHCYDLMLKYRSLRNEFSMGFALAGEK
ncbi:MAG: hypothetical protein WC890_06880 [Candidatus Margulisiibacteriota bacterium]